jgi:hypothetical protein
MPLASLCRRAHIGAGGMAPTAARPRRIPTTTSGQVALLQVRECRAGKILYRILRRVISHRGGKQSRVLKVAAAPATQSSVVPPVMVVPKRVVFGLLFATAFGVAAGVFKGNETGLRAGVHRRRDDPRFAGTRPLWCPWYR